MNNEILVRAEGVSKKFCRSLKRSLWYGLQDVSSEIFGRQEAHAELRENEFWAVDDVSFELRRGECLGLIGPNGAGKSTLLKMLNGLIKPDLGRVTIRGRVGALIELGAGFNPILTARENIYVNGSVLGFSKKEIDRKFDAIVDFSELEEFIDTPVQNFSSGMHVRLGFAVAVQMEPDVFLIDEVLAVGDTAFQMKCLNLMSRISRQAAIVFVSHSMPMISRMSSHLLALVNGDRSFFGGNVPDGISHYLKNIQFAREEFESSEFLKLRSLETGSPESPEAVTDSFILGQGFRISLKFERLKKTPDFIVNISFMDVEGKIVAQSSSSNAHQMFGSKGREVSIEMIVPALLLNAGRYSINIGVVECLSHEQRGEILYQYRGAKIITVTGGMGALAPVQFIGSWRFDTELEND